jgi:hypothetical protein
MRTVQNLLIAAVILLMGLQVSADNDTVFTIVEDNSVTLWDMDAHRNCASEYIMQIEQENQEIRWIQRDIGGYAYCYCDFDYSVTFGPLSPGFYTVDVYYTESGDSALNYVGATSFNIENPLLDSLSFLSTFSSDCGGINLGIKKLLKGPGTSIGQNYPNPFIEVTTIPCLPGSKKDTYLIILNSVGEIVRKIPVSGSGKQEITVFRYDSNGKRLPAGVYFYRMESPGYRPLHKMVVMD